MGNPGHVETMNTRRDPEEAQNGSLEASGRALGGSWAALGGPWGAKADFRAILGVLGDPFWELENAEKLS